MFKCQKCAKDPSTNQRSLLSTLSTFVVSCCHLVDVENHYGKNNDNFLNKYLYLCN